MSRLVQSVMGGRMRICFAFASLAVISAVFLHAAWLAGGQPGLMAVIEILGWAAWFSWSIATVIIWWVDP